jgi:hypothetical protein
LSLRQLRTHVELVELRHREFYAAKMKFTFVALAVLASAFSANAFVSRALPSFTSKFDRGQHNILQLEEEKWEKGKQKAKIGPSTHVFFRSRL